MALWWVYSFGLCQLHMTVHCDVDFPECSQKSLVTTVWWRYHRHESHLELDNSWGCFIRPNYQMNPKFSIFFIWRPNFTTIYENFLLDFRNKTILVELATFMAAQKLYFYHFNKKNAIRVSLYKHLANIWKGLFYRKSIILDVYDKGLFNRLRPTKNEISISKNCPRQ